jgi:hypothetical protein
MERPPGSCWGASSSQAWQSAKCDNGWPVLCVCAGGGGGGGAWWVRQGGAPHNPGGAKQAPRRGLQVAVERSPPHLWRPALPAGAASALPARPPPPAASCAALPAPRPQAARAAPRRGLCGCGTRKGAAAGRPRAAALHARRPGPGALDGRRVPVDGAACVQGAPETRTRRANTHQHPAASTWPHHIQHEHRLAVQSQHKRGRGLSREYVRAAGPHAQHDDIQLHVCVLVTMGCV